MEYVYDIVLNFQDKYYDFYEWYHTDKLTNIKRIPIYKVPTKDYLSIKNNDTIINKSSIPKKSNMFLLTNGIEIIGLLLANNGQVIKKSSLIFDESDDILLDKDDIKNININYQVVKTNKVICQSRYTIEKINYIKDFLKNIHDEYLLKYLYYDIFNMEEDNLLVIRKALAKLIKNDPSTIYTAIKNINYVIKKSN